MPLPKGSRLGPYEIEAPLGAGGMGEVYRARDTRLDRAVAVKILPEEFSRDPRLKMRFEREARIISQLAHPHICTLFDVGDGYLVMELLEGESLADRLMRGPLPISDALLRGTEIAQALDVAHRAGIVHRDLKPGNIMLTRSGTKLLDFGLAKSAADSSRPVNDATEQKPLTAEGTVIGTYQYMAPEQLEGLEADARTDIFALGCVLYEMATGRRAFEGKNRTSLVAAIVSGEPKPISEIQPLTPPAFEHVVTKCLSKNSEDRWQSAHDIAEELRWISTAGSDAGGTRAARSSRKIHRRWISAAAIAGWVLAIAAAFLAVAYARRNAAARQVSHTEITASLWRAYDGPLAVSPDGRRLALIIADEPKIWLRDLSTGEGRMLPETEGAVYPFWSPDGRSIGFFSGGKLRTINTDTSAVQVICDAPAGRGGTWSKQGVIVFAPNIGTPLMKVPENGGAAVPVTRLATAAATHRNPMFLPDGKHFLFCSGNLRGALTGATVNVGSIDGGPVRKILDYASNAAYVDGWLLTVRDRNLVAQKFDPADLSFSGKPVAVAQNIDWYEARYEGVFGAGGDVLVYHRRSHPVDQFLRLDLKDPRPAAAGEEGEYSFISVSPDGRRVIANRPSAANDMSDLWMSDLDASSLTRLTFTGDGLMEDTAVFSADGQRIAIASSSARMAATLLWIQPAGGGTKETILKSFDQVFVYDWSKDGRTLLIDTQRPDTGHDVEVIHLDGDRRPVPLVKTPADEVAARFSPDGRWVAYQSNESGTFEIYVTDFPAASAKWQVSSHGGMRPYWSADGGQIVYLQGGQLAAAAVHRGAAFSADSPRIIAAAGDHIVDLAVANNGTILISRELDAGHAPLSVVMNWQKMLLR